MNASKFYPLHQCPLYRLRSRKKLASEVFNVDLSFLEQLASNGDNFRIFHISQGEKLRQVETPKPVLERLHRRLFELLERIEKPDYLHSGVKGRSYITNAEVHVGPVPLVKLDIRKFYPSVDGARIFRFFCDSLQCSPDVAGLLTKLCLHDGHVPTGSCASQLLAYFAVKPLFDALEALSRDQAVRFTLYVDDMIFSGGNATPAFLWQVKKLIHAHGLQYHKDRTYAASDLKVVTGVGVGAQGISVLPSKEHDIWRHAQSLGSGDLAARRAAVERLLGSVVAAGQIEKRLLSRVQGLRALRSKFMLERANEETSAVA